MGKCYEQKDIFPPIQEAIERLCKRKGEANHENIIDELLMDPEASGIINRAVGRCPKRNPQWMAANMVAWLSKRYDDSDRDDLSGFHQRFKREKRKGSWAYLLR